MDGGCALRADRNARSATWKRSAIRRTRPSSWMGLERLLFSWLEVAPQLAIGLRCYEIPNLSFSNYHRIHFSLWNRRQLAGARSRTHRDSRGSNRQTRPSSAEGFRGNQPGGLDGGPRNRRVFG